MSAPIPGAEAVVAALRPHFKLCYRAGLVHDPSIEGSVVMDAVVSPDGAVTSVKQHLPTTLPPVVVGCLEDALKTAKFTPPGGTGSSIRVPVNFHHAGDGGS